MKDKQELVKLKDKLDAIEGKKRFDPAKAFQQHTKENDRPPQHLRIRDGKTWILYILVKFCLAGFYHVKYGITVLL